MKPLHKIAFALAAFLAAGLGQASAQVSLRGIYTASINSTLTLVVAVHDNNTLDAYLFDSGQQEVGKGTATIDASGSTNLTLIVDANDNLYLIHEVSAGVYSGDIGTVTPNGAETGGAFSFTSMKGDVGSGTFTTNAYTMSGSFTYSSGSFDFVAFRDAAANRIGNISTRGLVGTGQNVLIGGFIIDGGPKLVLVRVLGPGLAQYSITAPIMDPTVTLYHGQPPLASNTGWQNQSSPAIVSEIQATHLSPPAAGDDAILIQLEAGAYTSIVEGATGDTGTALVEVYEVLLD